MEMSAKILLTGGILSLAYGFLLGMPMSVARMKAPTASRHLVTAHLAAIIQGAMHLGLATAATFVVLPQAAKVAAAGALVFGSALFVGGATVNWLQDVGDHFAERSVGWRLLAASSVFNLSGIGVFVVGAVRAL